MPRPNDMVTPSVRLLRQIGEGGMGSVWLAEHLSLNAQVAVKFMSHELIKLPGAIERFSREASAAARVRNPHIVQVFDHGTSPENLPFIVMELLDGSDLGAQIERRGPLPLAEVANILSQACKGLGKAHAVGVIHRDIKPDNIFLTDPDGEPFVKVLDFGIAKQQQLTDGGMGVTSTGAVVGTPFYMSPEQMLGSKDVGPATDLWSLGVVVYQAVVGVVPFAGDTLGALFIAIERAQFAPASSARPGLPPAVDAWFARALARDPAQRFPSAKDMADAFQAAIVGDASTALLPAGVGVAGAMPGGQRAAPPQPGRLAGSTLDAHARSASTHAPGGASSGRSPWPLVAGGIGVLGLLGGVSLYAFRSPAPGAALRPLEASATPTSPLTTVAPAASAAITVTPLDLPDAPASARTAPTASAPPAHGPTKTAGTVARPAPPPDPPKPVDAVARPPAKKGSDHGF